MNRKSVLLAVLGALAPLFALSATTPSAYDPCEAVYQWSTLVTNVVSSETGHNPRGYLWLPPNTETVKGIVFGMHNMLEEPIFANPGFREILAANDWGIVWVTPFIPANSGDLTEGEVTAILDLMNNLATVSGHPELKTAPLCPIGHSALGGFPFRLSAAIPARATSMITVKGEWASKERDTGVFPYAVAAAQAGVRILQINGEYEDGVRRQKVSADLTNEVANADFTCWVDYGGGHFDWSDELCDAMARWIVGEKDVTLTREHATGTFTILGYEVNGTKVVQNADLHLQCLTSVSGSSFTMKPFFEPYVMAGRPVGWTGKAVGDANDIPEGQTAGVTTDAIIIQKIQGPGEYLGDGQWGVRYNRYDPAGYRAKEITFQAIYPGDDTFKRSVQQGQVNVDKPRTTFTDGGTKTDVVKTGWTLDIPDGYGAYVREGPAKISGGKVVLSDVPAHKRPNITVVTYKLDNTEDPILTVYDWGWDSKTEVTESTKLTEDLTCDQLVIAAGAVLDLNGHNLTVTGALSPSATTDNPALITNSVDGTTSTAKFDLVQGIGSQEFMKLRFGGNLALSVRADFSNANFLNKVANTHTGGTTLDRTRGGNGDISVEGDKNKAPRINTKDALGTGTLVFKNGAWLRDVAGSAYTYDFAGIDVPDGDNYFLLERNHAIKSGATVSVAKGATLNLCDLRNSLGDWNGGDFSGVLGTIAVSGLGSGNIEFWPDITNGTLTLTKKEIRNKGSGTWKVGALASPASVTASDSSATLRRTGTTGGKVTLEVGSANTDATWYGQIVYDNDASKDWNIKKVGTGTWTIGGVNYHHGTTEIAEGAIRLLKDGELGDSGTAPAINMTGGALYIPSDISHNPIARLKTPTTGVAAKLGVLADDTLTINQSLSGLSQGLTKVGAGTLVLGSSALDFTGSVTLEEGILTSTGAYSKTTAFNGGEFMYGSDTTDFSSKISGSTDYITVDTGDRNVTWSSQSMYNNNNDAKGFVKKGAGTLSLTGTNRDGSWQFFNNTAKTNIVEAGALEIMNAKYNSSFTLKSTILGTGTLRILSSEANGAVWLQGTEALKDFEGTLDWSNELAMTTYASGFMMTGNVNFEMPKAKMIVSGNPSEALNVMRGETQWNPGEAHVTVGAFDHLHPNAVVAIKNSAWTLNIVGTAGDSYLNGTFASNAVNIVKTGTGKIAFGTGFSAPSGSTITISEACDVEVAVGATLPKLDNAAGTIKVDVSDWTDCATTTTRKLFTATSDSALGKIEFTGVRPGYAVSAAVNPTTGKVTATATPDGIRWIGGTDGDWNTTSSWSGGKVPTANDNVLFDSDASVSWTAINNPAISNLYLNGTLTLKMPANTGTGDRGLHLKGIVGSTTSKLVLAGARLSTVEGTSLTNGLPIEAVDNAAKDENWLTGLSGSWTQTGAFTGSGTIRARGWKPNSATYLDNDNTAFEGTVIIDGDNSNGSCFRGENTFGTKMRLVGEKAIAKSRVIIYKNETLKLGSIWQDTYAANTFRVNAGLTYQLTLEIGGNGEGSLIMGQWGNSDPNSNTKIIKVGDETLQVYKPSLRLGWELNGGVVEAIGPDALEGSLKDVSISPVSFNGGTLKYGYDSTSETTGAVTTDWSAYIANSTEAIKVETTGSDVTWATAIAESNTKAAIVKSGKGRLILTATPAWTDTPTVTVALGAGSVLVKGDCTGWNCGTVSGRKTRAKTVTYASETYTEFSNPAGLMILLR